MPSYHITGGKPVHGTVQVSGAKNAASKMIIASLLTDEPIILHNVPKHQETQITSEIVSSVGATVSWVGDHDLKVHAVAITSPRVEQQKKNRVSILAVAPLLHRVKEAWVPFLGGDKIGLRPVDFHIRALESMGAVMEEQDGGYRATVEGRLRGTLVTLAYPSVGATETAILAGVLAQGRTVVENAAIEPEIICLIMMLQNMGAIIQTDANRRIEIVGVEKLHGCEISVIPDRLEAASYACMAIGTKGEVFVKGARQEHLISFLNAVRKIGGDYQVREDGILFRAINGLRGMELETDTYPGFATDWQQPFVVLLTQATGTSVVHETVYEERFGYTETLKKMGADITLSSNCLGETPCRFRGRNYKHSAVITGPKPLVAAEMVIPDIRAGLAYVVAAMIAQGTSVLTGVEHLDRGYEALDEKLKALGVEVVRK